MQIGCQLLPPQNREERPEEDHFHGGCEAVFNLVPGTGLKRAEKNKDCGITHDL